MMAQHYKKRIDTKIKRKPNETRTKRKNKSLRTITDGAICTKVAVTSKECIRLIKELESYKPAIIGFDIEWESKRLRKTSTKKKKNGKVSLLQLGHKDIVILIRLKLLRKIPIELHSFLSNIKILKAGIGIFEDSQKLFEDYGLSVFGCVDIEQVFGHKVSIRKQHKLKADYYKKAVCDLSKSDLKNALGLNSMSCMLLHREMKYKKLTNKNDENGFHTKWNNEKLSVDHINYAADDALIGYKLFIKLMDILHCDASYWTVCSGFVDRKKTKKKPQKWKQRE